MDTINASRHRTLDLPKSESGLTEWTSKIKALQRQVDEDDEDESRKLEEEIRASRASRMRRSTLQGHPTNFGLSKSQEFVRTASSPVYVQESEENRQRNQETTLRKLKPDHSRNNTAEPPKGLSPIPSPTKPRPIITLKPTTDPMSLAAFMGSKAMGPRLNKHASQQDVQITTQFNGRENPSAPHPVFGKGGVVMSGMSPIAVTESRNQKSRSIESPLSSPSTRQRQTSTPFAVGRYTEKFEQGNHIARVKKLSGLENKPRERNMNTPPDVPAGSKLLRSPVHKLSVPEFPPLTAAASPLASSQQLTSPTPPASTPRKSPVISQALARPAQRSPKVSQGPQFLSLNPSPAFDKPTPQKEVTPSLSRLQGRGFVRNMVKVSSQFEAAATSASRSTPQTPEKGTASDVKKPPSVLDRWPSSSIVAVASRTPGPVASRKAKSTDSHNLYTTVSAPAAASPKSTPGLAIKRNSQNLVAIDDANRLPLPSSYQPVTESATGKKLSVCNDDGGSTRTPGLGSSNTLLSYIKPIKTGDSPSPEASRSKTPFEMLKTKEPIPSVRSTVADETRVHRKDLGKMRDNDRSSVLSSPPLLDAPSLGNSLSHPTKDRAKKPKKPQGNKIIDNSHVASSLPNTPLTSSRSQARPSMDPPTPVFPARILSSHLEAKGDEKRRRSMSPPSSAMTATSPQRLAVRFSVPKVAEAWGNQPIIGVKPMLQGKGEPPRGKITPEPNGMVRRKAVPTLSTRSSSTNPAPASNDEVSPSPSLPLKPTRIPSTGNRATVMDVAQLLSEHTKGPSSEDCDPASRLSLSDDIAFNQEVKYADAGEESSVKSLSHTSMSAEKYNTMDKYTALSLPTLEEEKSPAPTLAGSSRIITPFSRDILTVKADKNEGVDVTYSPIHVLHTSLDPDRMSINVKSDELMRFDNYPEPLPKVDVKELLKVNVKKDISDPSPKTISVDVLSIIGRASTTITKDINVFYDNEILAIIHRLKVKPSELVETQVWGWVGKNAKVSEREEKTLADLGKRYGTQLRSVRQHCEPAGFIEILGGQLAIRQGSRAHWSSENTAMHMVRAFNGSIFIDEQDISVENLCSGFSYCLSILETFYVWYGCGSLPAEKKAALIYARSLSGDTDGIIELNEGANDDDDMFWMILGERNYAQAQYWKWKPVTADTDPRVWKVKAGVKEQFRLIPFLPTGSELNQDVFVFDCIWEVFVLVGSGVRRKRQDIRLALAAAMNYSTLVAASRPFEPTVHVLILPTQIPLDLRLSLRGIDVETINQGQIPSHMNILPVNQALEHLNRTLWDKSALRDKTMLPLGLHEDDVS